MNWKTPFLCCAFPALLLTSHIEATYTLKDGKFYNADDVATASAQEHFERGKHAFDLQEWELASKQFRIVSLNFPDETLGNEALFYLGASLYHLNELDLAEKTLASYLEKEQSSHHFQQSFEYRFAIAEKFRKGARSRIMGKSALPKWASSSNLALHIYDEIVQTLGNHPLAAKSLFAKGLLLAKKKENDLAIDAFSSVTKKFSKSELAPDAFVMISQLYYLKSQKEQQNSDLIYLSEVNARRFKEQFPKDARVKEAYQAIARIQEVYANGLYEIGLFYERCGHPQASILYYENSLKQFPETACAGKCQERLNKLKGNSI